MGSGLGVVKQPERAKVIHQLPNFGKVFIIIRVCENPGASAAGRELYFRWYLGQRFWESNPEYGLSSTQAVESWLVNTVYLENDQEASPGLDGRSKW
jgi:hypothetical protein